MSSRSTMAGPVGAVATLALLFAALAVFAQSRPAPSPLDGFRIDPGWVRPGAAPANHADPDWRSSHGAAAMSEATPCTTCHTEETCATCHAAEGTPANAHPAGYLLMHGADARDIATCTSCHTTSRFCRSCHLEGRLVGEPEHRPTPGVTVHPPGWVDGPVGGEHALEARMDLVSCASCHSGNECAQCHTTVSPHGGAFVEDCGPLLRASPRTCASCHAGASPLPMDSVRDLCR